MFDLKEDSLVSVAFGDDCWSIIVKKRDNTYKSIYTSSLENESINFIDYIEGKQRIVLSGYDERLKKWYLKLMNLDGELLDSCKQNSLINKVTTGGYISNDGDNSILLSTSYSSIVRFDLAKIFCQKSPHLNPKQVSYFISEIDEDKDNYMEVVVKFLDDEVIHGAVSLDRKSLYKFYPFVVLEKVDGFYVLGSCDKLIGSDIFAYRFSNTDLAEEVIDKCKVKEKEQKENFDKSRILVRKMVDNIK